MKYGRHDSVVDGAKLRKRVYVGGLESDVTMRPTRDTLWVYTKYQMYTTCKEIPYLGRTSVVRLCLRQLFEKACGIVVCFRIQLGSGLAPIRYAYISEIPLDLTRRAIITYLGTSCINLGTTIPS